MSSLKELKNSIRSLKETQKITEAMQMVSVNKLRRAQSDIKDASSYKFHIKDLLMKCAIDNCSKEDLSPLIRGTGRNKVYLLIVFTSEKGLCGGFNAQIIRFTRDRIKELVSEGKEAKIIVIGKKGYEGLFSDFSSIIIDYVEMPHNKPIDFVYANIIANKVLSLFFDNIFDICFCIHSGFKSVVQQVPIIFKLIPVDFLDELQEKKECNYSIYLYDSSLYKLLEQILFKNISAHIFWSLLENKASEIGARITAMDSATRNAGRMVDDLVLSYNRQRQMRITTELVEIIAGAEAIK
ncbi:ATP synthase F1 subunit gamma [Candidatus Liberibacter americanus]|uniref:ATP synthase gamma chain n=1 Tax=Candidatus Liberibacter americanus str. Sao Paulo TaxID=1261131 RepID=U6B6G0_9HYPH|nr:ATP synthase F1 subunit gamma [Candidatus Liberibacter americanus]AHA28364.1 F0F1-type ATP synthase gamma subunit [Candidatus Liberibacter americanus str. Sao Paulo]EMS36653.1 ATP synthase F0F1 subunit gamma [Candidatus Liberibacter americanus PW_SP]